MTNSFNKMAGKNSAERNGTPGRPKSTSKLRPIKVVTNTAYINSIATPPRSKPINIGQNRNEMVYNGFSSISRTSPGLVAGHFAGGKWSEPPSPATLPKPPQQWTQLIYANNCSKFVNGKPQQTDIASQLKVLLNVHA